MSFYVTLPSHANRHEFPNNQANSFKIRLPQPLRLPRGWMASGVECHFLTGYARQFVRVGAKRWVHHVDVLGPNLSQTGWKETGKWSERGTAQTLINDIQHLDWVVDGVSFMKATITHLEQQRKETAIQGGRFTNDQGKHMYVKFRWEGDDLHH